MAKFYSVTPGSDLDEFVDAAKKKFPSATSEQRHAAWKATGLFDTLDVCPRENRGEGSFNSWDFVKDNFKDDDKLRRLERALAEYRTNHPLPTWTHWEPFAVAWLRRSAAWKKLKPWIKPTHDWYASHALAA
jgi:hypothetical protein